MLCKERKTRDNNYYAARLQILEMKKKKKYNHQHLKMEAE